MGKRIVSFFETFIITAIFLVLIQTFMEDFSVLLDWTIPWRNYLLFAGLVFDIIFTIEFLFRMGFAIYRGKVKEYIFYKKGWIDFIASVPLLLFSSGPVVWTIITKAGILAGFSGNFFNILKVIKAIRIARILRLLRVLKIFKQIKHIDSKMVQRHIGKITALCISSLVFVLFIFTIFSNLSFFPSIGKDYRGKHKIAIETVLSKKLYLEKGRMDDFARYSDIIAIKRNGKKIYLKYDVNYYSDHFGFKNEDYSYFSLEESARIYNTRDNFEFFFDIRALHAGQAGENIMFFAIVIVMVFVILVYYSPHFAMTVTDPIHIMCRGIKESGYNFEVKIPDQYRDDDIFQLSELFNRVYLPLKDRNRRNEVPLELSIEDVDNILK